MKTLERKIFDSEQSVLYWKLVKSLVEQVEEVLKRQKSVSFADLGERVDEDKLRSPSHIITSMPTEGGMVCGRLINDRLFGALYDVTQALEERNFSVTVNPELRIAGYKFRTITVDRN